MKSIRQTNIIIELFTLSITILFILFILIVLRNNIKDVFIKKQSANVSIVDVSIDYFVKNHQKDFEMHIENFQTLSLLKLFPDVSDIYRISGDMKIKKIIKRDTGSVIFEGYDIRNTYLGKFLLQLDKNQSFYSPLLKSIENGKICFYLAKKRKNDFIVGKIAIEKLLKDLSRIAEYNGSIILLLSIDGFVLSSTKKVPELSFFQTGEKGEIDIYGHRYSFFRIQSKVFQNDIIILNPLSQMYYVIDSVMVYYVYFIIFLSTIFIVKIYLQSKIFINPLSRFGEILRKWDIKKNKRDLNEKFLKYKEIESLYLLFNETSDEIQEAVDVINKNKTELQKVKNYLKNIIDSMPSMLISISDEGIIHEWNNAATLYTGISASESIGKLIWDIMPTFKKYKIYFKEVHENKQKINLHRELIENGKNKYMNISFFPLVMNGEADIAVRLDDITDLEKTEEQLRQAQKMEAVGSLVGGFAHDFNNILFGIVGTISMMISDFESEDGLSDEELKDYLYILRSSGSRASDMVKQLLAISRRQEIVFKPMNLKTVINNVYVICRNTFDKRITIKDEVYSDNIIVKGDPVQLEQIFLNLCINAMHAMTIMRKDEKLYGGVLTVKVDEVISDSIFLSQHPDVNAGIDYWKISIQDTGVGMDTKTVAKVFDPFFSIKKEEKGTGLGLTIVYSIVQKHGGFIDVYSEPGKGSSFNVLLPKCVEDKDVKEEKQIKHKIGSGTILIIDDEIAVRVIAKKMLEKCGYKVMVAHDGKDGIKLYKKENKKIDLVILDINMPGLSGVETFQELKKINSEIKIIASSGFLQDERADRLIEMGAQGFLQKPFTISTISEHVKKLIESN